MNVRTLERPLLFEDWGSQIPDSVQSGISVNTIMMELGSSGKEVS